MPHLTRPERKGGKTKRLMASERQINSLLYCLLSKWSDSRTAVPTESHISPPTSLTSGGNDELVPNTADLRVDLHLWEKWTFIRTCLFLSLNWRLVSEYVSLALTWQRTNSSQLIRERSRVHWSRASSSNPKACLHWSSNWGFYYPDSCTSSPTMILLHFCTSSPTLLWSCSWWSHIMQHGEDSTVLYMVWLHQGRSWSAFVATMFHLKLLGVPEP